MKKLLLLLFLCLITSVAFAKSNKKIPPRLLRDIKIEKDDFNKDVIYSNKTPFYIIENDSVSIFFSLSCASSVPVKYSMVQILSNDSVITVKGDIKETPTLEKYAVSTFSSQGSSLSFNTRNAYKYQWKSINNIQLIDFLLKSNKFKVKFCGETPQVFTYDYYFVDKMRTIFNLYKYLKDNK